MKFIFAILFALVVATTASSDIFKDVPRVERVTYNLIPTDGLADASLVDEVNQFVVEKVAEFNAQIDEFNNVSETTQAEVYGIIDDATAKIEAFFKKIMDKINELKRRGGIYKKCAEEYEVELKEARLAALNAFKQCTLNISKALKDFAIEVGSEASGLTKNVLQLVAIVKNCYDQDGTLNTLKCALQSIKQVMETILNIVQGIKNLIVAIASNTKAIIASVKDCNENYIKVAQEKFHEYDQKVAECYKLEAFFH